MTKRTRLQIVLTSLLICFVFAADHSAQVTNGSFEAGTCPGQFNALGPGSTAITGWVVGAHSVDYICTYWQASDGLRSVDLSGNGPGQISQSVNTNPGWTYHLTFDLTGNPDTLNIRHPLFSPPFKTMAFKVNGNTIDTYQVDTSILGNTLSDMGWQPFEAFFTAPAAVSTINFTSLTPGFFGPAVDNVSLSPVTQVCYRFATTITPDPTFVDELLADSDYTAGPCGGGSEF